MSRTTVKRKVARWESYQPPRQWVAFLECGHRERPEYDDCQLTDENKARIEKDGFALCCECGDDKDEEDMLKARLAALKAKRNG